MGSRSFEELEVWKRSCQLAVRVYEALRDSRDFGLKDQMTRAAVSVASNIAEGVERPTLADCSRFIHFAKGSVAELRTQMYIAQKAGIIEKDEVDSLIGECREISKMLQSYVNYLGAQTKSRTHNL